MPRRIVAVVGSYRKKGIINQTVTVLLDAAKSAGASVEKIDLLDKRIAFCKSSAAPAPVARLFFGSGIKMLKTMAKALGAKQVKVLHIGLALIIQEHP